MKHLPSTLYNVHSLQVVINLDGYPFICKDKLKCISAVEQLKDGLLLILPFSDGLQIPCSHLNQPKGCKNQKYVKIHRVSTLASK